MKAEQIKNNEVTLSILGAKYGFRFVNCTPYTYKIAAMVTGFRWVEVKAS